MKTIYVITSFLIIMLGNQSISAAQSTNLSETFKKHFNETVQQVHETEHADEKRMILNASFSKMVEAIEIIETRANLSDEERTRLSSFKNDLSEKQNELNGLDGFEQVEDADLDEFSNFSQDYLEQASRTITLSLTTALLIVIILLLL